MGVLKVKAISLPYIFQVMYVLCLTRPRYQVSVYRTIGPLVNEPHNEKRCYSICEDESADKSSHSCSLLSDLFFQLPRDCNSLTHISLASFLWDIGKQNSPDVTPKTRRPI